MQGFGLVNVFKNQSVRSSDVLIGLGAGLGGAAVLAWGIGKYKASLAEKGEKPPTWLAADGFIVKYSPALGGLGAALLAMALKNKVGFLRGRASGLAVGAAVAGAAVVGFQMLKSTEWGAKNMAGTTYWSPGLSGHRYGEIVSDPLQRRLGMLVDDPRLSGGDFRAAVHQMASSDDPEY